MGIHHNTEHYENNVISPNLEFQSIEQSSGLPPLVHALKVSAERDAAAFHFPGHKRGQAAPVSLSEVIGTKPYLHDATELPELDWFSKPKGPLLEAKRLAAQLFGAKETWFLVGGTTCGVQAAILATCSPGDTIILPRNAHVSAMTGIIFSGAVPKYIVPKHNSDWDLAGGMMPSQVESAIEQSRSQGRHVAAVFVTSPTYHGVCSDLRKISHICHSHGIPLVVDEAHGAHFKFHPQMPPTALEQGADISIQSTHKVLCSFSQSSMIHISGDMIDGERLHKCLHALQTTSPNWLLLASLDAARHQLSTSPSTVFNKAMKLAQETKLRISNIPGIFVLDMSDFPNFPAMDPLRITVGLWELGLSGFKANDILHYELGVVPELVSSKSVTLAFSQGTSSEHVNRLISGMSHLSNVALGRVRTLEMAFRGREEEEEEEMVMILNPRDAFFSKKMKMKFRECVGEVSGEMICPFPPGIPILVPGEVITEKALDYLDEIKRHGGVIVGGCYSRIYCCLCSRGGTNICIYITPYHFSLIYNFVNIQQVEISGLSTNRIKIFDFE